MNLNHPSIAGFILHLPPPHAGTAYQSLFFWRSGHWVVIRKCGPHGSQQFTLLDSKASGPQPLHGADDVFAYMASVLPEGNILIATDATLGNALGLYQEK